MKKLMNKKGFTLMEMLIVVAIIVILVAISVPTFTANLNDSRKAVDDANMRAAKSAAVIYVMDEGITADKTMYYDADAGKISVTLPEKAYGQVDSAKGNVIEIKYTASDATYKYNWVAPAPAKTE